MLNELLEEYKDTDDKEAVLDEFLNMLWSSKYTLKKHKKYFSYNVNSVALGNDERLIELFEKHNHIELSFCKSYYKKKMNNIDYIRIHVNNMYGLLVDKNLYLPKAYYQLMLTPKKEYFHVTELIRNGQSVDYNEVRNRIDFSLTQAERIKTENNNRKINIKWSEYKKLINTHIKRLFENYMSPEEYEDIHGWQMKIHIDGWSENNYVIRYFCKSLTGYMRTYIRDSKVKKKYCATCGIDVSNRNRYCLSCYNVLRKENRSKYNKSYYSKIKNS